MKIIILAAGEGKRLRPYTNEIPKCMVRLAGNHMLSHQLSSIRKCNIVSDDIALVGGYKMEALEKFSLQKFKNPKYSSTNMVTTLFCARNFMKHDEDLVISYGDIVYEEKVLRAVLDCNEEMCVTADKEWERLWRLRMSNPLEDAETFVMDDKLLISELGKKPTSFSQVQAQYIGLIKISKSTMARVTAFYESLDKGKLYDGQVYDNIYMTSLIQMIIDNLVDVKPVFINGGWIEIDSVEDIRAYNKKSIKF